MKGFPKHCNSKADYEYIKQHFSDEQWKLEYQKLLDTQKAWLPVKAVTEKDVVVENNTNRVTDIRDIDEKLISRVHEQYTIDPNSKMLRLGFTEKEVESAIGY